MIKFVVAALWICAATVGAVVFSFQSSVETPASAEKPAPMLGGLDYVKTEIISVPVLHDNQINGYFLGRFVYTAEPGKLAKLSVPADTLLVDQVYSYLYGNPQIDFSKIKSVDLDALRSGVRDSINARIGEPIIQEVLVEQVDFLTKTEIRDNSLRRRTKPADAAPAKSSGTSHEPEAKPAAH